MIFVVSVIFWAEVCTTHYKFSLLL